jgi:hypothetical protein
VICIPYVPAASEANKRPCIFFEHGPLKTSFSLVHMSDSNSCLAQPTYKKYHYFLTDCDQRLNNNQEYNSIDLLRLVTRTPPCAVLCLPHSTLTVCKHNNILPQKGCTVAVELWWISSFPLVHHLTGRMTPLSELTMPLTTVRADEIR